MLQLANRHRLHLLSFLGAILKILPTSSGARCAVACLRVVKMGASDGFGQ